ncbi:MAG TPA: tripartite tricarboxylate transporter TctB family protein [Burkholderiales bacterium]|nr:tripartite tricarboxylate transporter TctB family protein [Burkholderiales bacterium]
MAAAAVVAVAAALFAATFWFEEMPEGITRGFGAELFPRMVLGTIIALALLLALTPASDAPLPRIPPMMWYSAATLLAFMALVRVAGMLPAMLVLLIGLGYLWGERRHWLLVVSAILLMAAVWGVFVKGFGVQLPRGLFA